MRVGLVVLLLLVPAAAHAQGSDPWLGPDKAVHFTASLVLARSAYEASGLWLRAPRDRALVAGTFAFSLGAAKELSDLTGRGDPSLKDLTWDAVGTLVGTGLSLLLDVCFSNRPGWREVLGG